MSKDKTVRIQIDDDEQHFPTDSVGFSDQPRSLRKAELNLRYETRCAELEEEDIDLQQLRLRVRKRLAAAQTDYERQTMQIESDDHSHNSLVTIDECMPTTPSSRKELDEKVTRGHAPVVESWLEQNGKDTRFKDEHLVTQTFKSGHAPSNSAPIVYAQYGPGLPEFKIDVFTGKPVDWPEWYLSFNNLIHDNPILTDGQKLGYLKTYLGPEPKSKVFGLLLEARDYPKAMYELQERYGNPALVIDGFIRKIRDWPKLQRVQDIPQYFTRVSQLYQMFKTMGYEADLQAKGLLCDLTSKIPDNMQESWGRFIVTKGKGNPTVELFYLWLKDREQALRFTTLSAPSSSTHAYPPQNQKFKPKVNAMTATEVVRKYCVFCEGEGHWINDCAKLLAKAPVDRLAWYKSTGRCFICAKRTHRSTGCFVKVRCNICSRSHATILHDAFEISNPSPSYNKVYKDTTVGVGIMNHRASSQVFLQTLPIKIHTPGGRIVETYGILDSGSQATLIQEGFAKDIGLNGPTTNLHVSGINDGSEHKSRRVSFWLSDPKENSSSLLKVSEAWTFDQPFKFPSNEMPDSPSWPHVNDLDLRPVDPSRIMVLIGANVTRAHVQLEVREGQENLPIAVHTPLGWTVMGVDNSDQDDGCAYDSFHVGVHHVQVTQTDELEKSVERFWQTESFGCSSAIKAPCSMEDMHAQEILDSSVRLTDNGHYEVSMLWSKNPPVLVNNRKLAERRFEQLERKLGQNRSMRERYSNVLNDYVTKGYARKLTPQETSQVSDRTYYLPHHAVINPKKPEKLRVVFDAAAVHEGTSLNHHLLTGPDLLNSLVGVLMRFRCGTVAISADIESMFHQVLVPKNDTDSLRFLWKEDMDSKGPPDEYQMLVHIFGAKSSPCCANYCLKRCALDNKDGEFSDEAIKAVLRDYYVDDMLKAVNSVPHAISLAFELIKLTGTGGFKLTKWTSNNQEVLNAIENLDTKLGISTSINLNLAEKSPKCRTLGMNCDMKQDVFFFESVKTEHAQTKRAILSKVSSVFDPLGLLAPFVLRAKLVLQKLWEKRVGWDDEIGEEELRDWLKWCAELEEISTLFIPRCYWPFTFVPQKYVLHTFCDASEQAFAACVYLVMISEDGGINVALVMSKTRVAPVKRCCLTLPRLELQGAVLAVRLHDTVTAELDLVVSDSFFWTDSLIVLQYINSESKRMKTFVANRISEIRSRTQPEQWRYVPGISNPADDCSRGLPLSQLRLDHRWFQGPEFLWSNNWPVQPQTTELDIHDDELKRVLVTSLLVVHESIVEASDFSRLTRLLRVTAWVLRFCHNLEMPLEQKIGNLTVADLDEARMYWVKEAQSEYFADEIAALSNGKPIARSSRLKSLTPILVDGVLRIGGRLKHARIPYDSKHQVIIPHQHYIANLLILDAHAKVNHSGPEHTIAKLRESYWVTRVRSRVKLLIHACRLCHIRRVLSRVPRMAQLPLARVVMGSVWATTGCDYFGPILIKRGRVREKRWVCLLTSMTVRAVHLEIANSLDTDAFILALRRFIARRGKPKEMYSDNGTNFVGANRELKEALASIDNDKVHDSLAERGIEWHFNAPKAPHMGGVWERLVRSVKRTLDAVLRGHCVHEDTLHTFLCEAESIVNSRPLTHVSSDPDDLEPLTPAHFLLGHAPDSSSVVQSTESDICSRKRWRQSQVLADHFWRRWRKEYLPTLTVTQKWTEEVPNLRVDDIVLVNDNNEPRGNWPLARVIEVCPGSDGRVRVVKVKTSSGTLTRPVARLCVLEEARRN